jgi:hypothetical protein
MELARNRAVPSFELMRACVVCMRGSVVCGPAVQKPDKTI